MKDEKYIRDLRKLFKYQHNQVNGWEIMKIVLAKQKSSSKWNKN